MSSKILVLATPEVKTLTHLKIAAIKVEVERVGKAGFIEIWFAKTTHVNNVWVEVPGEPGINVKIEGQEFEAFKAQQIDVKSIDDLETILYDYCVYAGHIPGGTVIDYV
jgi:hypothetical protein